MDGEKGQRAAFTLVETMIAVTIIGLLLGMALPTALTRRDYARKQFCIETLSQIESAKQHWALELRKTEEDVPTEADLIGPTRYVRRLPECPSGGLYKPEFRSPKSESRTKAEFRGPNPEIVAGGEFSVWPDRNPFGFRTSELVRISDFGIRASISRLARTPPVPSQGIRCSASSGWGLREACRAIWIPAFFPELTRSLLPAAFVLVVLRIAQPMTSKA